MLAVGASRYPEWGSASVVGGALFAGAPMAAPEAGALATAVAAALLTAWGGGWSMILLRKVNGVFARRSIDGLDRGSIRAVTGLQVTGLTMDLARGGVLTLVALAAIGPVSGLAARHWTSSEASSEAAVLAVAAAAAAGAVWRLFHGVEGAQWWFFGGLGGGLAMILAGR